MCQSCGPVFDEVRKVLLNAAPCQEDTSFGRCFLTVYQILDRLPPHMRTALINQHGFPGRGAGRGRTAAHEVTDAAEAVPDVQLSWLDGSEALSHVAGRRIYTGAPRMQLYRIGNRSDPLSSRVPPPTNVPPANILGAVRRVLLEALMGVTQRQINTGYGPCFLTDYQILALLQPTSMRDGLIVTHISPAGCSAAIIRPAAESLSGVQRIWLDAAGTQFVIGNPPIPPHSTTMPMYRIP